MSRKRVPPPYVNETSKVTPGLTLAANDRERWRADPGTTVEAPGMDSSSEGSSSSDDDE